MKNDFKKLLITKNFWITVVLLTSILSFSQVVLSFDATSSNVTQRLETTPNDIPNFTSPVALLVGLSGSELSYRELSGLAGFELFSVPYRSDIKTLVEQIHPTQVIIKHPSGFVGLYSTDGQLVRGVQITGGAEVAVAPGLAVPSIIQPQEANPIYENVYYPGSLTGAVPHGGLGYTPPPKGRGIFRHFLKLAALTGLVPFQYPGYFKGYSNPDQNVLFPALAIPNVPLAIGAAATYADAKLDAAEYDNARTQPRDYKFQPIIEGY